MITGFNGRGVLPGVATGTGLKPKSGKLSMKLTSHCSEINSTISD